MATNPRRSWLKKSVALAAAGGFAGTPVPAYASRQGKLQLSMHLGIQKTERHTLFKQIGVNHVITGAPFWGISRDQYPAAARKMVEDFAEAGFRIAGIEGHPVPFDRIKLGLEGRDTLTPPSKR